MIKIVDMRRTNIQDAWTSPKQKLLGAGKKLKKKKKSFGFLWFFVLAHKNYFHPLTFLLNRFQALRIGESSIQFSFLAV